MSTRVNINGVITPPEDARISVLDHGFMFGDSVYEALRTYGRKPFLFSKHFARLQHSAQGIHLDLLWDKERTRIEILRTLEEANNPRESRVRLIVTRGIGNLSPDTDACAAPTVVTIASPLVEPPLEIYEKGVDVMLSSLHRTLQFADVKTGNLIRQVLAFREAKAAGAYEAILLTPDGVISDGITSNMYIIRGGKLLTPSHEAGIIAGITRSVVLELARNMGLEVNEGLFGVAEIQTAEEMFLTSTTREIVPIARVDGNRIGNGKPGSITLALLKAYRLAISRLLEED
jgi:branched-chain amino acid aminotransferase